MEDAFLRLLGEIRDNLALFVERTAKAESKKAAFAAAYFFANAFSTICFGKSNPVFSRHTIPIFNKSLNVSCSLKSSFCAQSLTLSSVLPVIRTGIVFVSFSFISPKLHTKFILDNN